MKVARSSIDSNGEDYFTIKLDPEKLNERGLIDGVRAVDVTRNHKKQTSTISSFMWVNGTPCFWKVLKTFKNEIIEPPEMPIILKDLGISISDEEETK